MNFDTGKGNARAQERDGPMAVRHRCTCNMWRLGVLWQTLVVDLWRHGW
jgi:hypothetical protein